MKTLFSCLSLTLSVLLAGCASPCVSAQPPVTEAEVRQFALEMLNRSSLPYEQYEKARAALLAPSAASVAVVPRSDS
ncbi:MAG: hypothetical protein ABWY06_25125 [Pseudomonas sp.]|uniref:hypothetical protein n=1 Tax=Pseudomonas sp. TaxID=306 RepID=UPI0033915F97